MFIKNCRLQAGLGITMAVLFAGLVSSRTEAAPMQACFHNYAQSIGYFALVSPNGRVSLFSLPPGRNTTRRGDTNGTLCASTGPFGPGECPHEKWQITFRCD